MEVSPDDNFAAGGYVGGPFSPNSEVYTLINSGDATLEWAAQGGQPWVSVNPSGGSLGAGEDTTLSISINLEANQLPVGSYTDEVAIVNLSNGAGDTSRPVTLTTDVVPSDGVIEFTDGEAENMGWCFYRAVFQ